MKKLNFCIFCDYSLISKEGLPSFVGVFSEIIGKKLPIERTMSLVVNLSAGDQKKHSLIVRVKSPSDEVIKSFPEKQIGPSSSEDGDIGYILGVNFKFESEGIYNFEFLLDGEEIGKTPLSIKLQK